MVAAADSSLGGSGFESLHLRPASRDLGLELGGFDFALTDADGVVAHRHRAEGVIRRFFSAASGAGQRLRLFEGGRGLEEEIRRIVVGIDSLSDLIGLFGLDQLQGFIAVPRDVNDAVERVRCGGDDVGKTEVVGWDLLAVGFRVVENHEI